MKTPDRIIALLYDRDRWWSLDDLAATAGVGAVRLDRAMAELKRRGHQMEFSPTAGIRLQRPPALDAGLIERGLNTHRVGRHVLCFPVVDSTNDTAAAATRQRGSDGLAVLAEAQRAGRGRRGRHWLSPPGANVLMSVLLKDPRGRLSAEAITIAAGLAVAEGLEKAVGATLNCRLKWPNDVLLDGKKLAGVLIERRRAGRGSCLVIGMGVNVNAHPPASRVKTPAISLAEHLGELTDRIPLIRGILRRLDHWIVSLAADTPRAAGRVRRQWLCRCEMLNERFTIAAGRRRHTGRVVDIDPLDGITLLTDEGTRIHVAATDATVV